MSAFGLLFGLGAAYASQQATASSIDAKSAKDTASRAQSSVEDLRGHLDRLTLVCTAMWELMKEQGLTEEQLAQKVQEIDLADGQLDNKAGSPAEISRCSKCGRVMSRRHARCMYCGNADLQSKPFDTVR